jgi:hypothetical protein
MFHRINSVVNHLQESGTEIEFIFFNRSIVFLQVTRGIEDYLEIKNNNLFTKVAITDFGSTCFNKSTFSRFGYKLTKNEFQNKSSLN